MEVVCDIEANSLNNPTNIWVIVCRDVASGEYHIFREVTSDEQEKSRFLAFAKLVSKWIGHNFLGYDYPVLKSLTGLDIDPVDQSVCDTLVISKMVDYSRKGHSLENYGEEFGFEKDKFNDFTKYSEDLERRCVRDVDINDRVYRKYLHIIRDTAWAPSISLEQRFQLLVNQLHTNGFAFDKPKAETLLRKVERELKELDDKILEAFPPREVLIREFTPRETKHGTISKSSVPRSLWGSISDYEVGRTYPVYDTVAFNPASHKQLIAVLNEAGWKPVDKTQSHIDTERELNRLRYNKQARTELDISNKQDILNKLDGLKKTGWKINETNLATLPPSAPAPARLLAKRILLESRRRTLNEWLALVTDDGRIHGRFMGIGAWTHRMAHQQPNTANITSEFNLDGAPKLLGKELRQLWRAPKNRLLVGVDAEGIQLRIFAHYIDDEEFTNALVLGKKSDKSDPHSLNQRVLGNICRTRAAAKRFIFALLLGGGIGKLAEILDCSEPEAREALDRLLSRYGGFKTLKDKVIPADARRGWFTGLDGRKVSIPGDTDGQRKHLCMSGYLQCGEATVVKSWALKAEPRIKLIDPTAFSVNIVHDEKIDECRNSMDIAIAIAKENAQALKEVGEDLNLRCPLSGSYMNDDTGEYTIGTTWYQTH